MKSRPTIQTCRIVMLGICAVSLAGCPEPVPFQQQVDPACLQPDWIAVASGAITEQPECFESVLAYLLENVPLVDGNWDSDFGDARFYAPAVLLGLGYETDNACLLAFGRESLEGNRAAIRAGRDCPLSFWLQLPEQVMAAYGLVETYQYEQRAEDIELIDVVLDRVNAGLGAFELYPDVLADSLLSLYGPTTQTAGIAALNLRHALQVGGPRGPERAEFGLQLIDAINKRIYEPDRGIYRFSTGKTELYLYPNAMMIVANCLAYQASGEEQYLRRAEATLENIQALKDADQGNYRSPYSAELMGAETGDYSTLSSQLYTVTALYLLYESTGDAEYMNDARDMLEFICTYLRDEGRLVHHWIDGRPAQPDDPEYYCSGCNFQAMHVLWHISHLQVPDSIPDDQATQRESGSRTD